MKGSSSGMIQNQFGTTQLGRTEVVLALQHDALSFVFNGALCKKKEMESSGSISPIGKRKQRGNSLEFSSIFLSLSAEFPAISSNRVQKATQATCMTDPACLSNTNYSTNILNIRPYGPKSNRKEEGRREATTTISILYKYIKK